jgi:hypothetical protein
VPDFLCEERLRLTKLYIDAVAVNQMAGRAIAEMKSEAWREATRETREICTATLADLLAHRKEHGC